jgi:hypothetical protein
VVDPVRQTEGVFVWRQGKPTLAPHYWVGDRVQVATAAGAETPEALGAGLLTPPSGGAGDPRPAAAAPAARAELDWLNVLAVIAVALLVFLGGFLLAGKINDLERRQIEQRTTEQAMGRWTFLNLRPGLYRELDRLRLDLSQAVRNSLVIFKEQVKASDKPRETEARWKDEVFKPLGRTGQRLDAIQATYCLPPKEEEEALQRLAKGNPRAKGKKATPGKKKKPRKRSQPKKD